MTSTVLHLSDTHVGASGRDADGVDAVAALDGLLHDLRHLTEVDLVVVSGDVADDGSAAGCRLVRERIGDLAARLGAAHVYATGNHDRRPGFVEALGTGHRGVDGRDVGRLLTPGDAVAAVSVVDGLRVVTLDTLVPGEVHGELDAAQLDALARELAEPSPAGTVLVFHHPPIAARHVPWTRDIGLRDAERLAAVVAGTDVRAVLCGHLHLQLTGPFAGTTVWVTPGVVSRFDLTAPPHLLRAVRGASASVVELGDDGPPTCHVLHARDPHAGQQILVADPTTWELVDGSSG